MSQRNSGYERQANELYETPPWVVDALVHSIRLPPILWEPACGRESISDQLKEHGFACFATDLPDDFLTTFEAPPRVRGIVTNPPYGQGGRTALRFIEHAMWLMEERGGMVAMLLQSDFDHGKTRKGVFDHPTFCARLVLRDRIVWFDTGSKHGPSQNHAWFVWDWRNPGGAKIYYAEKPRDGRQGRRDQTPGRDQPAPGRRDEVPPADHPDA